MEEMFSNGEFSHRNLL